MYYLYPVLKTVKKYDNTYSTYQIRKTKPKGVPFIANKSKKKLEEIEVEIGDTFFEKLLEIEKPFFEEVNTLEKEFEKVQKAHYAKLKEIELKQENKLHETRSKIVEKIYDTNPAILI